MNRPGPIEGNWLDLAGAEALAGEWQALAERSGADVWFRPAWLRPWCRHFAGRRELLFFAARREGALVGLLPFVRDTVRPGGIPLRLAQLAGPHPLFGVLALPVDAAHLEAVLGAAISELLAAKGCDCVSLAPLSDTFGLPDRLTALAARTPGVALHPDTRPREHTIIPLPESFDTYLSSLSRNRRNKYRKTKRTLEETHGVRTRVLLGAEAARALEGFIALHNRQWTAKGKLGHFADWPGSAGFYAEFCEAGDASAEARLYIQETDNGDTVSALFCFVAGRSCVALVPARDETRDFPNLNIGLHAQFERIEHLIAEGVAVLDSGAGQYDYKASLKGETQMLHRLLFGRESGAGRAKLRLLRGYANLLDLLYYRVWFNRAAPWLRQKGLPVGPLWKSWIRTRV